MDEQKLSKIIFLDKTLQACKASREYFSTFKAGPLRIHFNTDSSPGLLLFNTTLIDALTNAMLIIIDDVERSARIQLEELIG